MSTRAQIVIEGNPRVYIYKHSDGHPDSKHGVMAWLKPIVDSFTKDRGHDPAYLTAQIIRRLAVLDFKTYLKELVAAPKERRSGVEYLNPETSCVGHGVDSVLYPDIDYLYIVKNNGTIEVRVPAAGFWDKPSIKNTVLYALGESEAV